MKKLVNGVQVGLNVDFWLDYLKGKTLNKITISNIHTDLSDLNKKSIKIIQDYAKIYDNLDPIIKDLENDLKYGVLGELLGEPYSIYNASLYIKDGKNYLNFKGEHWSICEKSPSSNITMKTLSDDPLFDIFNNILKRKGKQVIQDNFPDLWNAVDQNQEKLNKELDSILTFINIDKYEIYPNTIMDFDKKVKYTVIKTSARDKGKSVLTIDINSNTASKDEGISNNDISIYKQDFIDFSRNCKDFGPESKVNIPEFLHIIASLKKHPEADVKGVILNNTLFFELDSCIYKVQNNRCSLLIKNGSIYGYVMKDLLVFNTKKISDILEKRVIFLLKNNLLDPVKYEFKKIGDFDE